MIHSHRFTSTLMSLIALMSLGGCAPVAEQVGTRLATEDLKKLQQDICLFENDLALFRGCLKHRFGTCSGAATTALPGTAESAAGQIAKPIVPGSSTTLRKSIAELGGGDPARRAYELMTHPVVQQATGLHNHLRGHESETKIEPAANSGRGRACGPEPTHTVDLGIHQIESFHGALMTSIGQTSWQALSDHCSRLLKSHADSPDLPSLQDDCRRAAFIRTYIGAYLRQGRFVKVNLEVSDEVSSAVGPRMAKIVQALEEIQGQASEIAGLLPVDSEAPLSAAQAHSVAEETASLVAKINVQIHKGYQVLVAKEFLALEQSGRQASALAAAMATGSSAADAGQLSTVLTAIGDEVDRLEASLGGGSSPDGGVTGGLEGAVQARVEQADAKLSNVFKIQSPGFVSRDLTFGARLPTLELALTLDGHRLGLGLLDVDPDASPAELGQELSLGTETFDLGVVTQHRSGVGTGASVGAEVVRVFFEAIFDAHEGLPALAQPGLKATGLSVPGANPLPLFTDPTGEVSAADLGRMIDINTGVALQTRLIIGRVVSGFGPFSLNNQPLEDLITETIATSVRKATAKATWCWYACNLDQDVGNLKHAAAKTAEDSAHGALSQARKDFDDWVHREAQYVKIRFKLSP